ncbi:MAG: ATP phosphoribosyltransferase regulatory subunit [Pseudomonadota bacterium]
MTPDAAQKTAITAFEPLGGELVDPPSLMPASRPLDVSGEAVRARLCVFSNASGNETALRPDLTLPVAELESARRKDGSTDETTYRYSARAFRLPTSPDQTMEFVQVGFERFGAESTPASDADAFGAVMDAIDAANAPVDRIILGDLAIFDAFVAALELADETQAALRRAFRLQGGVSNLLQADAETAESTLIRKATSQADAESLVSQMLELSGTPLVAGRSVSDIAERLRAKADTGGADGLTDAARLILRDIIQVRGTSIDTLDEVASIAQSHGLYSINPAIEALSKRFDLIKDRVGDADLTFDTTFGRRFNYYDGFVFEIFAPGAADTSPMGAGGRYDSLIHRLSAGAAHATGIGGVVRPERLADAVEAGQ